MCLWQNRGSAAAWSSAGLWAPQEAGDAIAAGEAHGGLAPSQQGLLTLGF